MSYAPGSSAGAAGRREERKAENRAKLLAAARKVFAEKGLGAATARDIVRETDLATGTFYNYFRDKEDAFRELLEEAAERQRAVAPSFSTSGRSSSLRTVAVTRAPAALASWIAAVPTPPAPPCTSR